MSDQYAAPSGPPPPRVPDGWKAVWNDQYKEWFYVNLHTKESTWERPTEPAPRPGQDNAPPGGAPPSYQAGPNAPVVSDTKKTPLDSNNPYGPGGPGAHETDEEMARRLQREEQARQQGHSPNPASMSTDRGHADSYYNTAGGQAQNQNLHPGYGQQPSTSPGPYSPGTEQKRGSSGGFFGKLKDKFGGPGGYPPRPSGFGGMGGSVMSHQAYNHGGYAPQPGYGGYPPQGQYGYPQQGYMQQGHGGYMQQPVAAKKKHGMGAGGAAALGVGGGLLGGMLLADAIGDHDQAVYDQGFDAGDDFGGGDFGGGDF